MSSGSKRWPLAGSLEGLITRVDNCGCINSKVTINIYLPIIRKIGLRDLYVTQPTTAHLIRAI